MEHWMAAFVYCDEVLVCDANKDEGILKGKLERMKIEQFNKMCLNNREDQGEFEIPKLRVQQEVDGMRNWGSYGIVLNNCQEWITKLLTKLGVRDTAPHTSALGTFFTVGLAATTIGCLAYLLYKARSPPT